MQLMQGWKIIFSVICNVIICQKSTLIQYKLSSLSLIVESSIEYELLQEINTENNRYIC